MEPNIPPTDTTDKKQSKRSFLSYGILGVIAFLIVVFMYNKAKNDSSAASAERVAATVAAVANPAMDAAKDNALNNPSFDSYLNLGLMYYRTGENQYCINATLKALEFPTTTDKQAMAYNNLCSVYNVLSMSNEAIKACQKAISLSADFQLAKNNLKVAMSAKKE